MSDQALKVSFYGKIKRFPVQSNYLSLQKTICDSFLINNTSFSLYYVDEEGDQILIENNDDYDMGLKFAIDQKTILKIFADFPEDSKFMEDKYSSLSIKQELKDLPAPEEEDMTTNLFECNLCQRKFTSTRSFGAHSKVCEKLFINKPKKFDSYKKRIEGIANSNGLNVEELLIIDKLPAPEGSDSNKLFECKLCLMKCTNARSFNNHFQYCKKLCETTMKYDANKKRLEGIAKENGMTVNELLGIEQQVYEKCETCHRSFKPIVLTKHVSTCHKLKKRNPFSSKTQRIPEEIIEVTPIINETEKTEKKKRRRWNRQSKNFRDIVRLARKMMKDY